MKILLIRHASVDGLGTRIAGRLPGIHLNEQGRFEAETLAKRMDMIHLDAIYSSPLERAQETAAPVARYKKLPIVIHDSLNEIDFGEWTGKSLNELERLPEWREFNEQRAAAQIPEGESMAAVSRRITGEIQILRAKHSQEQIAIFSHCDPLRAGISFFLGVDLDHMQGLSVDPASVSILEFCGNVPTLLVLNGRDPSPYLRGRLEEKASLFCSQKSGV